MVYDKFRFPSETALITKALAALLVEGILVVEVGLVVDNWEEVAVQEPLLTIGLSFLRFYSYNFLYQLDYCEYFH